MIVANSILGIIDQFGDVFDKKRRKFEARFVNDYGVYEVVDTEKGLRGALLMRRFQTTFTFNLPPVFQQPLDR